jgi:hypothetical protein
MTALAVISALVTALCIGYHFGRRAGSTPSTWRKRTSRVALSKLAVGQQEQGRRRGGFGAAGPTGVGGVQSAAQCVPQPFAD